MSINKGIEYADYSIPYNGIPHNNEDKWITSTHNIDEFHKHSMNKRSQSRKSIYHTNPFIKKLKRAKLIYGVRCLNGDCPWMTGREGRLVIQRSLRTLLGFRQCSDFLIWLIVTWVYFLCENSLSCTPVIFIIILNFNNLHENIGEALWF